MDDSWIKIERPAYFRGAGAPRSEVARDGVEWKVQEGTLGFPDGRVSGVQRPAGSVISDRESDHVGGNDAELKGLMVESVAPIAKDKEAVGTLVSFDKLFESCQSVAVSSPPYLLVAAILFAAWWFGKPRN